MKVGDKVVLFGTTLGSKWYGKPAVIREVHPIVGGFAFTVVCEDEELYVFENEVELISEG